MTRRLAAFALLTLLSLRATMAAAVPNDSHDVIAASLRRHLVGKATLDGQEVTDVEQKGRCVTQFSSAAKTVAVDWTQGGTSGDRNDDSGVVIPLQGETSMSELRVAKSAADGIDASLTVLYGDCQSQ